MFDLVLVGDHSFFNQRQEAVGEHLRMDAQFFMVFHSSKGRVGDSADAHLQGSAIVHQLSDITADADFHVVGFGDNELRQRIVHLHHLVEAADVYAAVARGARHVGVDLCDEHFSRLCGGQRGIHRDPQAAVAALVGRGYLQQGYVQVNDAPAEQTGCLAEKNRDKIGPAALYRTAQVRADKHIFDPEAVFHRFVSIRGMPFRMQLKNLDIAQRLCPLRHCFDQYLGRGRHAVDKDLVARLDGRYRFLSADRMVVFCVRRHDCVL